MKKRGGRINNWPDRWVHTVGSCIENVILCFVARRCCVLVGNMCGCEMVVFSLPFSKLVQDGVVLTF